MEAARFCRQLNGETEVILVAMSPVVIDVMKCRARMNLMLARLSRRLR